MVAAVGHTEATYEQTRAAIAAGATVGTHLFNAMRPIDRREPGPVVALLEDSRVTVELITDGVHVDPAHLPTRHAKRGTRPGLADHRRDGRDRDVATGSITSGPLAVDVVDGVARVAGTDTIAGSTATMDRVFRFAVTHSGLPRDEALMLAVRQASINPARALGLPGAGLVPGRRADMVVLDSDLAVTGVLRQGSWVNSNAGATNRCSISCSACGSAPGHNNSDITRRTIHCAAGASSPASPVSSAAKSATACDAVSQFQPPPRAESRNSWPAGSARISATATSIAVSTRSGPVRPSTLARTVSTMRAAARASTASRMSFLPPT